MHQILFDSSKSGLLLNSEEILVYNSNMKSRMQLTKLAERVILNHKCFAFEKNAFVYAAFDRKIVQLVESGLADKFIRDYESSIKMENFEEIDGPVVLTLNHLGVGFQIWLLFVFLSIAFFLLEMFVRSFLDSSYKKYLFEI